MNRQYGALSGAAIALIALNHAIHFGLQVSPVEGAWLRCLIFLQALGTFAVPAFLFVSGAFVSYAAGGLSFSFVKNSLGRIVWPYVIWSVVFYGLVFLTADVRYPLSGYIKNLLVGYPYHFVPLLVFWYLTSPVVARIGRRHGVLLLVAIGLYQAFLLVLRWPDIFAAPAAPRDWMGLFKPPVLFVPMSDWAIYFPLGLVLSLHATSATPRLLRLRWCTLAATVVLFALGMLDAYKIIPAPWARFVSPLPPMFLLPIVRRDSIPMARGFEILGRRSYGIYLTHFVVLVLVVSLAGGLRDSLHSRPLVVFPMLLIVAVGASLLLMDVMARVAPLRRVYRYVFGIAPPIVRTWPPDQARPAARRVTP